jgi:hypothetical protein
MFDLLKIQYRRRQAIRNQQSNWRKLIKGTIDPDRNIFEEHQQAQDMLDGQLQELLTDRLLRKAERLDVAIRDLDDLGPWWTENARHAYVLTPRARTEVRKLLDDETTRRFDVSVRWIKLLTPLLASVAGTIGTITGLVAVLKK